MSGLNTIIKSIVIITYQADARNGSETYLRANNFQIVLALQDDTDSGAILNINYDRIDTLFGIAGMNVPSCVVFQIKDPSESRYLVEKSNFNIPGSFLLSTRLNCGKVNTGELDKRYTSLFYRVS